MIEFNREQVQALLEIFGSDDITTIGVDRLGVEAHSGPGLYAFPFRDCGDVSVLLDAPDDAGD